MIWTVVLAVLAMILSAIIIVQRSQIAELRDEVEFWKKRDAQWRDPNQPRPLPVGTRY